MHVQTQADPYDLVENTRLDANQCVKFKIAAPTQNVNLNIDSTGLRTYLFFSSLVKSVDIGTTWNVDLNSFSGDVFTKNYKEYVGESSINMFFNMSDTSKLLLAANAFKTKNQKLLDELVRYPGVNSGSFEMFDRSENFIVILNLQNLKKADIKLSVGTNVAGVSEVYIRKIVDNSLLAKIAFPTSLAPRTSYNNLVLLYSNASAVGETLADFFNFENMNIDLGAAIPTTFPKNVSNSIALMCESSSPVSASEQASVAQLRRASMDFKINKFKRQLINRALLRRKVKRK